jgi:hypothetical protein
VSDKVYVGDVGTAIEIDVQEDISTATNIVFNVRKGDGSVAIWTPTLLPDSQTLRYITKADDINVPLDYKIQVSLMLGTWVGRCETVSFRVSELFE